MQIFHDEKLSSKHLLDLNLKNNAVFILLSEESIEDNLITVNLDYSSNFFNFKANNFTIDFLSSFFLKNFFTFENLKISGDSSLTINKNSNIENFNYNLYLNGNVSYETNFDKKILNFNNDKLYGIFNDNELSVSLNFNDNQSIYEVGVKTEIKKTTPTFFFIIDNILVKNLLKIWPNGLMNSTFIG